MQLAVFMITHVFLGDDAPREFSYDPTGEEVLKQIAAFNDQRPSGIPPLKLLVLSAFDRVSKKYIDFPLLCVGSAGAGDCYCLGLGGEWGLAVSTFLGWQICLRHHLTEGNDDDVTYAIAPFAPLPEA